MTFDATTSTKGPLENTIPPHLACVAVALAMWASRWIAPAAPLDGNWRLPVGVVFVLIGLIAGASGFRAFRRAKTTIDPVNIEAASSLVTGGIFRYTRNPMYVGMAALLIGWAVYLASPWAFLGPIAFVLFITRFQIVPEERAMRAKFGSAYADYQKRVRRWL